MDKDVGRTMTDIENKNVMDDYYNFLFKGEPVIPHSILAEELERTRERNEYIERMWERRGIEQHCFEKNREKENE